MFSEPLGELGAHHVLFIPERRGSVRVLLEVFSSCWFDALTASRKPSGSQRELEAGVTLGDRYEVTARIGAGGFAVVYEARDLKVERQVAVKVIDLERHIEERARESFVKRFEREARLAASVRHACIVEILDVGVTDLEVPYIVMERLEGWDLDEQSRRDGPMDPERFVPLFIQALEGLGCAHEKGIVHKDLKPSNIFLKHPERRHEQLCILDFGVARRINTATARLTHTDSAFGTPHYMAPEYSTSQIATPALDVYQMGLILVEMLMGEAVVSHPEPVAAMFQHVRGDLAVPEALLESPLGPVLAKALATHHLERYQDAFEFADALKLVPLGELPRLERGSPRLSLRSPVSLAEFGDDGLETPIIGTRKLASDSYPSAPHTPLAPPPGVEAGPATELDRVHEISPFASTLPFDDLPDRLEVMRVASSDQELVETSRTSSEPSKSEAASGATSEPASAPLAEEAMQTEEPLAEPIVDFSSKRPYLWLIALLCVALLVTLGALFHNRSELQTLTTNPPPAEPVVILNDYDRELEQLRQRAEMLEPLLSQGRLDEMLEEVEAMDASSARLTPDEVDEVKRLVSRAHRERVNRAIADRAMALSEAREHERALDKLSELEPKSVFWRHDDVGRVLKISQTALLSEAQAMRLAGRPQRALALLNKLVLYDPENAELVRQKMEITEELKSQPPLTLPINGQLERPLSPGFSSPVNPPRPGSSRFGPLAPRLENRSSEL